MPSDSTSPIDPMLESMQSRRVPIQPKHKHWYRTNETRLILFPKSSVGIPSPNMTKINCSLHYSKSPKEFLQNARYGCVLMCIDIVLEAWSRNFALTRVNWPSLSASVTLVNERTWVYRWWLIHACHIWEAVTWRVWVNQMGPAPFISDFCRPPINRPSACRARSIHLPLWYICLVLLHSPRVPPSFLRLHFFSSLLEDILPSPSRMPFRAYAGERRRFAPLSRTQSDSTLFTAWSPTGNNCIRPRLPPAGNTSLNVLFSTKKKPVQQASHARHDNWVVRHTVNGADNGGWSFM